MIPLTKIVRQRFIDLLKSIVREGEWKVLVMDKHSTRVISACCSMYDIMDCGITLVEPIDIRRQPIRNLEAIYFITPSPDSVERFISDFKDAKNPQYAGVHLIFTSAVANEVFDKIKASAASGFVRSFKEFNLQFLAIESQAYSLDRPESLQVIYGDTSASKQVLISQITNDLVTLLFSLNELGKFPRIRYGSSAEKQGANSKAATLLASTLTDRIKALPTAYRTPSDRDAATILILDRSYDVTSPVMHEFTYQAMIYDLLSVEKDVYKYEYENAQGVRQSKEVILSELHDNLWPTLRHLHISDAIKYVVENFNSFVASNKAIHMRDGEAGIQGIRAMSEAIRKMPQFQEMMNRYSLHLNMTEKCMDQFRAQTLEPIAGLEQDIATGETASGGPVKNVVQSFMNVLTSNQMSETDKIRLLMLLIISQDGVKDADRRLLIQNSRISRDGERSITNLARLGVNVVKSSSKKTKSSGGRKRAAGDVPFELSRYVPPLKYILEDLANGSLSEANYPAVPNSGQGSSGGSSAAPVVDRGKSARGGTKQVLHWAAGSKQPERPADEIPTEGGRIIVFIIGGMTHSEMRAAYEITKNMHREVLIGSTHILTPQTWVESMKSLEREQAGPS
eukprot:TRINITY_DN1679_c0_g1_i1.p1 TRINITY_DN1679_c0_g1~~TRINITY_DN1679_c0_g1_i1.p1  ORF type:complete len:623 (-),score=137.85 TRINITY_DN1679_c0_g1_i1:324-2192(-)